ncbi:MAG: FAD-dependent oxidoreductase [Verrucomicrobiota bacterium]
MKTGLAYQVAVIGAGPYGLAAAAHLRAEGIETRVFGEAMGFWASQMPEGMLVRSTWDACHIADPHRQLTLDAYSATQHVPLQEPLRLREFIEYGQWFQKRTVPDLDPRRIVTIKRHSQGFQLTLDDGEAIHVQRVVVATGISRFAWSPPEFDEIPAALASHTSEHQNFRRFAKQRVAVVGGGQMALESAALLKEIGAEVEVLVRQPKVHWLDQSVPWLKSPANPFRRFLYPPTDVGPPGLNWIVATPDLFRRLPRPLQEKIAHRSIRPAGTGWLLPRLHGVPITVGCFIRSAVRIGEKVKITLSDGTDRLCDHVLLGTGYRVDISRYPFLTPEFCKAISSVDGYPLLRAGFESSVPGLHFLGASAARSFGPVCRFVSGTTFCGPALTRVVAGQRTRRWKPAPLARVDLAEERPVQPRQMDNLKP